MNNLFFEQTFEKIENLILGEYENCSFINCDFKEKDFSEFKFIECEFFNCNLSLIKINSTVFTASKFINCKMIGLHFNSCYQLSLSFSFENCQLNNSSFYKTKIKNTIFRNCNLEETDFVEADLSSSIFDKCNLMNASFDHTSLEKSDFRNSYNYIINPEINKIKKAKFSINGIEGLLKKYDIVVEP